MSIPKINFSGLIPGTTGWDTVEAEVMKALETYGCFEASYDCVTPELREALFSRAIPEVFSLPSELKKPRKSSDLPLQGYIDMIKEFAYESFFIEEDNVEQFTNRMWPQGNSVFSDAVSAFIHHMKELERTMTSMIFHSLGVENYYDSHIETTEYSVPISAYGVPFD